MRLKFWPFPVLRNNPASSILNEACEVLLEADWWRVQKNTKYDLVILCPTGRISFWNANKYYAWGNSGSVEMGCAKFSWRGEMPSRWHVRQIAKRLAREIALDMRIAKEAN